MGNDSDLQPARSGQTFADGDLLTAAEAKALLIYQQHWLPLYPVPSGNGQFTVKAVEFSDSPPRDLIEAGLLADSLDVEEILADPDSRAFPVPIAAGYFVVKPLTDPLTPGEIERYFHWLHLVRPTQAHGN